MIYFIKRILPSFKILTSCCVSIEVASFLCCKCIKCRVGLAITMRARGCRTPWLVPHSGVGPGCFVKRRPRMMMNTIFPGTIITNYIKGRNAYKTYSNHTSKQRQFITGVPQGGVLLPTLFNIYTSDLPPPSAPVQVMAYADDITITSTHTSTSAAKKYIHPYLQKVFAWTKQNNLILNPDKTT